MPSILRGGSESFRVLAPPSIACLQRRASMWQACPRTRSSWCPMTDRGCVGHRCSSRHGAAPSTSIVPRGGTRPGRARAGRGAGAGRSAISRASATSYVDRDADLTEMATCRRAQRQDAAHRHVRLRPKTLLIDQCRATGTLGCRSSGALLEAGCEVRGDAAHAVQVDARVEARYRGGLVAPNTWTR
jgi:hypothetical protein